MARTRLTQFSVTTTGVGRADYSQNVQKSVEPITQAWQQSYKDYLPFALGVGEAAQAEVRVPDAYTAILTNIYLSCYPASDIALEMDLYVASSNAYAALPSILRQGNTNIDIVFEKGLTINHGYLITVTNLGAAPIDCYYNALGILTLATQLQVQPGSTMPTDWRSLIP